MTSYFQVLQLYGGEAIDWVGAGPPVDEPACGFLGENCIPGPGKSLPQPRHRVVPPSVHTGTGMQGLSGIILESGGGGGSEWLDLHR